MNRHRLGEILVRTGLLSQSRLDEAVAELQRSPVPRGLIAALVDRGDVSDRDIARVLSQELSVPWVSLARAEPTRSIRALVPRDVAERYCVAPVYVRREPSGPSTLIVAMDDPTSEEALYTVSVFAGMPVRPVIAPRSELRRAIARWYYQRSADDRPTLPAIALNDDDLEIVVVDAAS